jgi:PAS domain-containing protein
MLTQSDDLKLWFKRGYDLIGILDAEGNYTYVSPTSTAILGITQKNL